MHSFMRFRARSVGDEVEIGALAGNFVPCAISCEVWAVVVVILGGVSGIQVPQAYYKLSYFGHC